MCYSVLVEQLESDYALGKLSPEEYKQQSRKLWTDYQVDVLNRAEGVVEIDGNFFR